MTREEALKRINERLKDFIKENYPSDHFDLVVRVKQLEESTCKLILAKQDAEGQLDILRPGYGKLQERIKQLEKEKDDLSGICAASIRQRGGLATRLLEIHKQAGESCPNAPSPIDAYKMMAKRIKELEEILAKIKSDPSIGRLEVEDNWWEKEKP